MEVGGEYAPCGTVSITNVGSGEDPLPVAAEVVVAPRAVGKADAVCAGFGVIVVAAAVVRDVVVGTVTKSRK